MTTSETNDNNNNDNNTMKMKEDKSSCYHQFRLFSYLSMSIVSVAIIVGVFLVVQHMHDEDAAKEAAASQADVLKNQKLLLQLNQDQSRNQENVLKNQKLLIALSENQTNSLNLSSTTDKNILRDIEISMNNQENIIEIINITNRDNAEFFEILKNMTDKLNLIIDHDQDTNKKIDKIMKKLKIYRDLPNDNMTLS